MKPLPHDAADRCATGTVVVMPWVRRLHSVTISMPSISSWPLPQNTSQ